MLSLIVGKFSFVQLNPYNQLIMKKITTIILLLCVSFSFSQSPWTQKKGTFYTQLSFSTIPAYNTIYANPDRQIAGKITDQTMQFYTAYGISEKTTLTINIPYKSISHNGLSRNCLVAPCPGYSNKKSTFGNIEIGVKHLFSSKKWLITGQLNVEVNSNSFEASSGIRTGYEAWSFTPLLIVGKGAEKKYMQFFSGFTYRTNDYSSNFKIGGEFGYKVGKRLWLSTFIDIVKSLNNGDFNTLLSAYDVNTALYIDNQEYGGFGFKASQGFSNNFGLNLGVGGAFFANNVPKQIALTIGLYHKF